MRAVIIGTDFVRDTDGSFKAIETNTNIHPGVDLKYYFDVNVLDTITSGSSINEIHFINKRNLRSNYQQEIDITPESELISSNINNTGSFALHKSLESYCQSKGFTFNHILLDPNSMTIPHIEDSENKLIIRISYDVTALIDDTYARDNWEFLKLMYDSNPSSIPATYINDTELGFDSIGTTIRNNGVHPNYMVKKRITPADNHIWPIMYKINTLEELNTLKSVLADDEYIQEYILNDSDLLDGRLTHYRSVDLIYGSNLDVLNLWNVQFSNAFELDTICDYDDENKIQIWERPKYIYKYNNNEKTGKISADGSTKVFLPNNTLTLLSSLNLNDSVKSIVIPDLPLNEADVDLSIWSGSYTNLMQNFQVSSSALLDIVKKQDYTGFLYNIECTDGIKFSDVSHAMILKKELESGSLNDHIIKFVPYSTIKQNDTLILFDSQTNGLVEKQVQSIVISYDNVEVYAVNFEELDLFLTSEETGNRYGLLTHNYSYDCKSVTCSGNCIYGWGCTFSQTFYSFYNLTLTNVRCLRCGGPGYPPCSAAGFNTGNPATCLQFPCFSPSNTGYPGGVITAGYCNPVKSDINFKENIKLVGKSESGLNIYEFNYKDEDGLYEGVIANELIGTQFENSISYDADGYLIVDYYKIDVQFKKIK